MIKKKKTLVQAQEAMSFMTPAWAQVATMVLALGVVVAVASMASKKVGLIIEHKANALRSQTIINCAQASRYTYTEKSQSWERVTEEPSQNFFQECLRLNHI